jgi:hypothetical protein
LIHSASPGDPNFEPIICEKKLVSNCCFFKSIICCGATPRRAADRAKFDQAMADKVAEEQAAAATAAVGQYKL